LGETPKAFANFSPGFEHRENPGNAIQEKDLTLKGFGKRRTLSGLSDIKSSDPRVVAGAPTLG